MDNYPKITRNYVNPAPRPIKSYTIELSQEGASCLCAIVRAYEDQQGGIPFVGGAEIHRLAEVLTNEPREA